MKRPLGFLPEDPWFAPLHARAAGEGFPDGTITAEGRSGWFLDPAHLLEHIQACGMKLRWAYRPEDQAARPLLEAATDIMAHCRDVLTPAHAFVGSFASLQATFFLFAEEPVFSDGEQHVALAFCMPGDVLKTGFAAVATRGVKSPWIDKKGMADCLELRDMHEDRVLLSIGAPGRGRDLHTIFAPNQANMEHARTWTQRTSLDNNTARATGQGQKPSRL